MDRRNFCMERNNFRMEQTDFCWGEVTVIRYWKQR